MAKTTDPTQASIETPELFTYTPETKPGRYDGHIIGMIKGDEFLAQSNPDAYAKGARTAVKVVFPGPHREQKERKTGEKYEAIIGEEAKYKRQFQESAKQHSVTANVVNTTDQGDGYVMYEFTLTKRKQYTKRAKPETESTDSADTAAAE